MEINGCRRSCKTKSFWNKTRQSWLRAKAVITEFPRHYPDLRDYDSPPRAGSAGAGCSALGSAGTVSVRGRVSGCCPGRSLPGPRVLCRGRGAQAAARDVWGAGAGAVLWVGGLRTPPCHCCWLRPPRAAGRRGLGEQRLSMPGVSCYCL